MVISSYFPIWNKLTPAQQSKLTESAVCRKVAKGTVLHNGSGDCAGLFLVDSGQLRAYILSEDGKSRYTVSLKWIYAYFPLHV